MFQRVTIIGLGLIGGSIGLALRKAEAAREVVGYDMGKGVCDRARQIGAISQASTDLADAVRNAELVILATPVRTISHLFQQLAPLLTPGTVVTDVASTKAQIIGWAEEFLPHHVAFVGGHPMAGKEISGVEAADATLFYKRIYCVTPTAHTQPVAIQKVSTLAEIIGARIRLLDAHDHDRQVAAISHLPFLASVALVNTVGSEPDWSDTAILASTGFRDASRLAEGNSVMYRDICLTNTDAITHRLDEYIAELNSLRDQLVEHDPTIIEKFLQSQQTRRQWQEMHKELS
ncbi:prephenate dehydrogenase [Tengunoibacter tsumagoiensis]|uniref:Prephenate dehydrogenase n=1 Tax=Tengunoibacter tsumagoiensis TaxID=2014871 RepID=A0A401ZZR5_9CHLR|nr:prephenate dehydrogenase/arogenate dehydrogenase family protein [Tengunoibacter tsumagoiensis]GCE12370.1 prephenate dehydrogenase [Tengunoibacter tsumagoiensis]